MKHNRIRGALALLLMLSLFVGFGALTAFAGEAPAQQSGQEVGLYDSMAEIRAIIIFKQSFDPRGGTYNGSTDKFVVEMPMGRGFRLPAAPVKEGDTFVAWEAMINGEAKTFAAREKVHIWEKTEFKARWESDGDISPSEAAMKLGIRG